MVGKQNMGKHKTLFSSHCYAVSKIISQSEILLLCFTNVWGDKIIIDEGVANSVHIIHKLLC